MEVERLSTDEWRERLDGLYPHGVHVIPEQEDLMDFNMVDLEVEDHNGVAVVRGWKTSTQARYFWLDKTVDEGNGNLRVTSEKKKYLFRYLDEKVGSNLSKSMEEVSLWR